MVTTLQSAVAPVDRAQRPCIAILLGAPLNAQNLERTGITYLSPHADIVVFDCKPWLGRSDADLRHEAASWDALEAIASPAELEQALWRHRPDYALDYIGLGPLTPDIQRILAAAGTRFVVQKSGSLPQPSLWSRLAWKLRARHKASAQATADTANGNASQPAQGLLSRVRQRVAGAWKLRRALLAPDLALLAGSASFNYFTRRARKILWVGSQDYHIYQRGEVPAPDDLPAAPYAVFIDDNIPYASDWSLLGLPAPVAAGCYYPAMRRVLSQLEAQWDMPVVIAAHPSARHDERVQQGFGARMQVHGRTADLVRGAQAVLLHGSTSVSFAVLGNKPLLFLSSEELLLSSYGLHIHTMAGELGQEPLNIDRSPAVAPLTSLAPRPDLYAKYTDRYLCRQGCEEAGPWQAFINYIKAITPTNERIKTA